MAGQEGFEPPTCGFGDRRSSRWSYCPAHGTGGGEALRPPRYPARKDLPGFAMHRVLLVPGAIFFNLKAPGGVLLILPGAVIPALALGASEKDIYSHDTTR